MMRVEIVAGDAHPELRLLPVDTTSTDYARRLLYTPTCPEAVAATLEERKGLVTDQA